MDTTFARQAKRFFAEPSNLPLDPIDQPPPGFDPAAHPLIARHFFGVEPFRPIGEVVADLRCRRHVQQVHRIEHLRETANAPA